MYLLTFTFLVIGMLGIYTQVAAIEAARLYQSQSGIGQAMLTWHKAAMSLAGNVVNPAPPPPSTGCGLTFSLFALGTFPVCSHTATIAPGGAGAPVIVTGGPAAYAKNSYTNTISGTVYNDIPAGYNFATYQWKSVAFVNPAAAVTPGYYVVTYVDPAPVAGPGPGFISTGTIPPVSLGITQSDLYQQLQNSGVPAMNMGYISKAGGTLITNAWITTGAGSVPVVYTVPAAIPPNSLAIISQPSPCTSC